VVAKVDVTKLKMETILDAELEGYLNSGLWEGKAGAFGYQDRPGWLRIISGSESNVVGLPLELLRKMLAEFS
jgi:septum formation protein